MRKQVLSKTVALITAMGLATSSVNVAYADTKSAESGNEGESSSGSTASATNEGSSTGTAASENQTNTSSGGGIC